MKMEVTNSMQNAITTSRVFSFFLFFSNRSIDALERGEKLLAWRSKRRQNSRGIRFRAVKSISGETRPRVSRSRYTFLLGSPELP